MRVSNIPIEDIIAQLVEHFASYRRGHGFESRLGLNFTAALVVCVTAMINRLHKYDHVTMWTLSFTRLTEQVLYKKRYKLSRVLF